MYKRIAIGLAALCALAVSSSAHAAVALNPSSGSNSQITYSNGVTDNGLFGNPTLSGVKILFSSPSNFKAVASNSAAQTTSDRVSFLLKKTDGSDLDTIAVSETGDWSILGTGLAKVSGALFFYSHDAATFGQEYSVTPVVTYKNTDNGVTTVSPVIPSGTSTGIWTAELFLDLPTGLKTGELVLNNNLQVTAGAASTSLIQKKGITIGITVPQPGVPEPTSMAVLFAGGSMLLFRRRKAV